MSIFSKFNRSRLDAKRKKPNGIRRQIGELVMGFVLLFPALSMVLPGGQAMAATLTQLTPSSSAPPTTTINGTTWVEVSTPQQLYYIDQNQSSYLSAHIELVNNIDLSFDSYTWIPIGNSSYSFDGTFNGNGYVINGLTINDSTDEYVGFFGKAYPAAMIENVGITNASVKGTYSLSGYVGVLAGYVAGNVKDSFTTGAVTGVNSNGGLIGYNSADITNSFSTASVTGGSNSANGGFEGVFASTIVQYSYATGKVTVNPYSGGFAAGDATGVTNYRFDYFDTQTTGQTNAAMDP